MISVLDILLILFVGSTAALLKLGNEFLQLKKDLNEKTEEFQKELNFMREDLITINGKIDTEENKTQETILNSDMTYTRLSR